ncbi:hypothetical protein TNCV_1224601 [Trichonephila clavipes]|nr:hypothetical protein TNCV_1224601 [Trichonephila clavipes]
MFHHSEQRAQPFCVRKRESSVNIENRQENTETSTLKLHHHNVTKTSHEISSNKNSCFILLVRITTTFLGKIKGKSSREDYSGDCPHNSKKAYSLEIDHLLES